MPEADYVCYVHITASQAALAAAACSHAAISEDVNPAASGELMTLAGFFNGVALRPQDFPPTDRMARTLKTRRKKRVSSSQDG